MDLEQRLAQVDAYLDRITRAQVTQTTMEEDAIWLTLDFKDTGLKEIRDLFKAMSKEDLVALVDSDSRLKERVDLRAPLRWRENPHYFWVQIVAVLRKAHLSDEEYYGYLAEMRKALP
jgi:hypothetical protein